MFRLYRAYLIKADNIIVSGGQEPAHSLYRGQNYNLHWDTNYSYNSIYRIEILL